MAGVVVQQQLKRYSGRRDGSWQDHPDYCSRHLPYGEEESERTISYYCATQVK